MSILKSKFIWFLVAIIQIVLYYVIRKRGEFMTDNEQKKIFSKNLTKLLNEHNKTQKEVANAIDVSPQTFNTWCKGIALPRMGKVQMLADYFGILKSDLIENKNDEQNQSYYLNPETSKIAQEIYDNKELSLLFDAARDAEPEDLQTVHSMLMALKRKENREWYTILEVMHLNDDYNINVQILDFGNSIPATVTLNDDGSFSIFLNARLSYERRLEAYLHEIRHIQNQDFCNEISVNEMETVNEH